MHIIPITLAFLLIFAMFSAAQLQKLQDFALVNRIYSENVQDQYKQLHKWFSDQASNLCKPSSKNSKKNSNDRGKRSRFLRIKPPQKNEPSSDPKRTAEYLVLRHLIAHLYIQKQFFIENNFRDQDIDTLIQHIFEKAREEKITLKHPEDLATISLDDERLQIILYKILKGNFSKDDATATSPDEYKSLCSFIRFRQKDSENDNTIASLYSAPPELLYAILQDEDLVREVIKTRLAIFNELKGNKKLRAQDKDQLFYDTFYNKIPSEIRNFIDYKVSKTHPNR